MQTAKILIVFSVLWFEVQQSPAPAPDLFIYLFKSQQSPAAAPDDRIVGGQEASVGQFPFIASLKTQLSKWYFHFCGGSALSTTHIITAAHCVDDKRAEAIFVSMGDHNKNIEDENEEMIQAKKIVIHQAFDVRTLENDIAIIKLRTPFALHPRRQTIQMMPETNFLENKGLRLTTLGWGTLSMGGQLPKILNFVELPYIDHATCKSVMKYYSIFEGSLCAGDVENGKIDACQGDSGGPIVYRESEQEPWVLAGLVSWGIGCAKPGYAGIYTNVAHYKEWIEDKMRRN